LEIDCTYLPYRDTNSFSDLVYDYIDEVEALKPFYEFAPNERGIEKAIQNRKQFKIDRRTLVNVLSQQYQHLPNNTVVEKNIQSLLSPHTFTICTAHQPNLLTGYLYFFYKILHAIKMAEELNIQHPQQHFVPVYYMGSEDNDLDELGQFWYEGQKYKWSGDGQIGAVGRMETKSLHLTFDALFKKLGPPGVYHTQLINTITESYLNQPTVAAATQYLVHQLFGHLGLVVLNPDDAHLKSLFVNVLEDELFNQNALPIVKQQSEKLANLYKAQAFPRQINLFYLKDDIRERIEKEGDVWSVINTTIQFSESEIRNELKNHPERFSPNVILRGLFQESILPNICFIGGGSELAYWMQLKPLFEFYKIFFPVVYLRQSVQILDSKAMGLIANLGFELTDIFKKDEELIKKIITQKNGESWILENEQKLIEEIFRGIATKAINEDTTLKKSAEASFAKMRNQIAVLEKKIYRAQKRKEKEGIDKMYRLEALIAPNGVLQERIENFMPYYLRDGFGIFEAIKNHIKPFGNQFLIVHLLK
jgi:bacillithiol synthase